MKINHPLVFSLMTFCLAACSTTGGAPETTEIKISSHPAYFQGSTLEQQALIKNGQIEIGFLPSYVELAIGKPDKILKTVDDRNETEVWHYFKNPNQKQAASFGGRLGRHGYYFDQPVYRPTEGLAPELVEDRLTVFFQDDKVVGYEKR